LCSFFSVTSTKTGSGRTIILFLLKYHRCWIDLLRWVMVFFSKECVDSKSKFGMKLFFLHLVSCWICKVYECWFEVFVECKLRMMIFLVLMVANVFDKLDVCCYCRIFLWLILMKNSAPQKGYSQFDGRKYQRIN